MITLYHSYDARKPSNPPPPVVIRRPSPFQRSQRIQTSYERSLRGVAREVGRLIRGHNPSDLNSSEKLMKALKAYSSLIEPWARHIVERLLRDMNNQDVRSWREHTKSMSEGIRKALVEAPVGRTMEQLMREQVELIQSIPVQAAERVHELVMENLVSGKRSDTVRDEILKTENVTKSRATLIARTETARASSVLTQARASHVGSESYIWRTSQDLIVRKSHREVNGHEFRWDSPPKLSDGTTTHPGAIYNCRCYAEPLIPEED